MKSIWGDRNKEKSESITGQVKTLVKDNIANGRFRASRPPQDIQLSRIFNFLGGKNSLIEKRKKAADVLLGAHGLKNRIHAKLLLGPKDFEEVLKDPEDIIPVLIELLGEKNEGVRAKAAQALGERGDERALDAMYSGLNEEKYWVRYEFADALEKISVNLCEERDVRKICSELEKHVKEKGEFKGHLRKMRRTLESFASRRDSWSELEKTPLAKPIKVDGGRPKRPDTTLKMHRIKR